MAAEALVPVQLWARLLGLAPYRRARKRYVLNSWAAAWTVLLLLMHASLALSTWVFFDYSRHNDIMNVILILRFEFGAAACVMLYVKGIKSRDSVNVLLNHLRRVDASLCGKGVQVDSAHHKKVLLVFIIIISLFSMVLCATELVWLWRYHDFQVLQISYIIMAQNVVIPASSCVFCCYLYIIRCRFRLINREVLQRLIDSRPEIGAQCLSADWGTASRISFAQIIDDTKKIHLDVCKVLEEVGAMYSMANLSAIVLGYYTIFTWWYCCFTLMRNPMVDNGVYMPYNLLAMLFLSIPVVGMTYGCDSCIKEARRSGVLVFRVLAKYRGRDTARAVRAFALQLLTTPRPIRPGGLASLSMTLNFTVTGVGISFLVMLIQLDYAVI